jgi:hypothetical protein
MEALALADAAVKGVEMLARVVAVWMASRMPRAAEGVITS